MVRSFERRDREANTRVPLALGGGESTAWLGFGSRRTSPSRARIRRFKKQCEKAGILAELRKREHTRSRACDGRKKAMAARKRALRRASRTTV